MPNSDPARTDEPESTPAVPPDEASSQTDCFQVSRVSLVYRYLLLLALTLVGALLLSLLFPMAVSGRDYLIGGLLARGAGRGHCLLLFGGPLALRLGLGCLSSRESGLYINVSRRGGPGRLRGRLAARQKRLSGNPVRDEAEKAKPGLYLG